MKKKRMAVLAVALAAVVTVGALAATLGSADDPLVTLSYLTQVFRPQAVDSAADEAQDQVAAYQSSVSSQVSRAEQTMEQTEENLNALVGSDAFAAQVAEQAGLDDPEGIEQTLWQTVTLSSGQTLTAGEGTQVLLRAGTAQAGGGGGGGAGPGRGARGCFAPGGSVGPPAARCRQTICTYCLRTAPA